MTSLLRRTGAALVFVLAAIGPSHATPPQVVDVDDRLFGANDTHFFVLRTLVDNLGTHHLTLTDTILVSKRINTCVDDGVWPVRRVLDHGTSFADYEEPERVEILPLAGQINPFDILDEQKAWPLAERPGTEDITVRIAEQALEFESADEARYRIGFDDLAAQMTASLNRTRSGVPAYLNEGGVDDLQNLPFNIARDCEVVSVQSHFVRRSQQPIFVKIECEDEQYLQPTGLYIILQPTN